MQKKSTDISLIWFAIISLYENQFIYCYVHQYIISAWIIQFKMTVATNIAIATNNNLFNFSINGGGKQTYIYIKPFSIV